MIGRLSKERIAALNSEALPIDLDDPAQIDSGGILRRTCADRTLMDKDPALTDSVDPADRLGSSSDRLGSVADRLGSGANRV